MGSSTIPSGDRQISEPPVSAKSTKPHLNLYPYHIDKKHVAMQFESMDLDKEIKQTIDEWNW